MVGFKDTNTADHAASLKCEIHKGTPLIKDPKDKDSSLWICPECGLSFEGTDSVETGPVSRFGKPGSGLLLKQPDKKKKKLRAGDGNEIPENDTQAIQDLAHGLRVLKYNEWKPDKVDKK
jgi:hypothetical protein